MAARRRRSLLTAASGSTQIAYHGNSHAVDTSSAIVLQPAATRQSAPRAVRHSAYTSTTMNAPMNMCRHQLGVPLSPSQRAVSAGMLCTATSCCCSPTAPRKPNACTPKPTTPTSATNSSAAHALSAMRTRSRAFGAPSTMNGSARPAVSLTPTPTASAAAPARARDPAIAAPAVSDSAAARASITSVSLCAPPIASTSNTGFRPTNAAAQPGECPSRPAARAISATAARLERTAIALNAHIPPATPDGTSA